MSEANSELLLLFFKVTTGLELKIAPGIERKRDSIDLSEAKTKGNFSFQIF
jgi:hypothetical protein